jgi:hypothetical protein
MPDDGRELVDSGKVDVSVLPRLPWVHPLYVQNHEESREWDSAQNFDTGEKHQSEISARIEIVVSGKKLLELSAASHKGTNGEGTINQRNTTDDNRPARHEWYNQGSVIRKRKATIVFIDVEPVTLDDILKSHLDYRDAHSNRKIDQNRTPFLRSRHRDCTD